MEPSEAEFLAEKEMIKIIPNFSLDKVFLIGVTICLEGYYFVYLNNSDWLDCRERLI